MVLFAGKGEVCEKEGGRMYFGDYVNEKLYIFPFILYNNRNYPTGACAMYDERPTRRTSAQTGTRPRPAQSRTRAAQSGSRPRPRKRRRRRRIRLSPLAVVILVSMAVGFLLGFVLGRATGKGEEPASTQPPAEVQSQQSVQADPQPQLPEENGDKVAPQILGVNKLSIFLGSTVAYRSGILVTDDTDPAPKLTVDSSQVNLAAVGTYPVYYNATDSAGNTTSVETTITVVEAPESYVDEAVIKEKADELLAKITTDDMTPEQKVNAIYDWIEGHCYYIAEFDKSDYMQAAYLMLTNNRGDCYGFYAVSRLLFERLGLPNLTVARLPNEVRTTNHWWNMVSLDNGESWYHFDSTPHLTYPTRTCLFTDAQLNEFNLLMPNYYYFDHEAFPSTPTE